MRIGAAILRVRGGGKVQLRVSHPMHTGTRKNKKTGKIIPAHHVTEVTFKVGGKVASVLKVGPAVSKNPVFTIYLSGANRGNVVAVIRDNKGATKTVKSR